MPEQEFIELLRGAQLYDNTRHLFERIFVKKPGDDGSTLFAKITDKAIYSICCSRSYEEGEQNKLIELAVGIIVTSEDNITDDLFLSRLISLSSPYSEIYNPNGNKTILEDLCNTLQNISLNDVDSSRGTASTTAPSGTSTPVSRSRVSSIGSDIGY